MNKLIPLSDRVQAIILGSLLGDGSLKLHTGYKNARFSFRHSVKQKDYFFWKVSELKEIAGRRFVWVQGEDGKDGWGGKKLRFQSIALPTLTDLYNLTHKKDKFLVRRKWLNKLTSLSLMIWWLDDGSLIANSRKGVLCTDGFSIAEVRLIRNYLKTVWSIITSISKVGKGDSYRLHIRSTEQLKKMLRIILPHMCIKDMLPKVLLLYKDSQLQQRWISEVSRLTGFPASTVIKQLNRKKLKWKNFR